MKTDLELLEKLQGCSVEERISLMGKILGDVVALVLPENIWEVLP